MKPSTPSVDQAAVTQYWQTWLFVVCGPMLALLVSFFPSEMYSPLAKLALADSVRVQAVIVALCLAISPYRLKTEHWSLTIVLLFVILSGTVWTVPQVLVGLCMVMHLFFWSEVSWRLFNNSALLIVIVVLDLIQRTYLPLFSKFQGDFYLTAVAMPMNTEWLGIWQVLMFCLPLIFFIGLLFYKKNKS